MTVTVPHVMRCVRNCFAVSRISRDWELRRGALLPRAHFLPGEWIAIADGPVRGIWQLDENGALPGVPDASWTGDILLLEPPAEFLHLCDEIAAWAAAHPDPTVTAEHFGEYSRSQTASRWEQVFAPSLAPYRRMYPEVNA